jgi:hypothetical protein
MSGLVDKTKAGAEFSRGAIVEDGPARTSQNLK